MASRATNESVARLRDQQAARKQELDRRHAAQARALTAAGVRRAAVVAAEQERESASARLNAAVADARAEWDVAVAVLVLLSSVEEAAELVGPSVAEVRRAVQRAPKPAVDAQAEQWLAGGRARRPRVARVSASREAGELRAGLARAGAEQGREGDRSGDVRGGGETG